MQIKTTHPFVNAAGPVAVGTILDVDAAFAAQLLAAKLAEPLKTRKETATAAPVKETATAPAESAKSEPAKQEPAKQEPAKQEPAKQEPAKQEPAKQEPAKQEPAKSEPTKETVKADA